MAAEIRALLDELMGKERDVSLDKRSNKRLRYDDKEVCPYDLAGICPHGLFKNTKSDMGMCQFSVHKDHIEWPSISGEYEKQDDREKERFDRRLIRVYENMIHEMDRKVSKQEERAERESAPRPIRPDDQIKLDELTRRAKEAMDRSQKLGEEGDVDAALLNSEQAEMYTKQHDDLKARITAPERILTVCRVCGVFVHNGDEVMRERARQTGKIPQPILDHLSGKQYIGWRQIRLLFEKLQDRYNLPISASQRAALKSIKEDDISLSLEGGKGGEQGAGGTNAPPSESLPAPPSLPPSSAAPPPSSDRDRDRERDRDRDRDRSPVRRDDRYRERDDRRDPYHRDDRDRDRHRGGDGGGDRYRDDRDRDRHRDREDRGGRGSDYRDDYRGRDYGRGHGDDRGR